MNCKLCGGLTVYERILFRGLVFPLRKCSLCGDILVANNPRPGTDPGGKKKRRQERSRNGSAEKILRPA